METKTDQSEVVFFNDAAWIVSSTRICWPSGVIRLVDVQTVDITSEDNRVLVVVIGLSLMVAGPVFFGVYGWALVILGILAYQFARLKMKLKVRATSGSFILIQFQSRIPAPWSSLNPKEKAEFAADSQRMESIQEAIRKALVHSTAPR